MLRILVPMFALALSCAMASTAFAAQGQAAGGEFAGAKAASAVMTQDATDISAATVVASDQTYTGSALKPSVTVTLDGATLVADVDYTAAFENNTNAGTATVTVTGAGEYTGTATGSFAIKPAAASGMAVASIAAQAYTGKAITPTPAVTFGSKTLAKGTDYTLSYANNVNVGKATLTVTGTGNFTGTKTATFKIAKASFSSVKVAKISAVTYTGKYLTPKPTVTYQGKTLKNGTDFTLKYKNNKNVGKAQVVVKGAGNFKGKKTVTFTIKKASISGAKVKVGKSYSYTGYSITPSPTVKYKGSKLSSSNYSVSYKKNLNAGTARVIVKGKGNFKGKKTTTFKIKRISISNAYIAKIVDQAYITGPLTPNPPVTYNGKTLKSGKDFKYIYSNNVNRGVATLRVEGKGNFYGSQTVRFNIVQCAMYKCTISGIYDMRYTGAALYPSVTVTVAGNKLVRDRDYQVTYSNNVNIGVGRIYIQGLGGFVGTVERTFNIVG